MFSFAIKYFEKSMNIWNDREILNKRILQTNKTDEEDKRDSVFIECAYNLVVIHKKMGNKALAAQLVSNFLKN